MADFNIIRPAPGLQFFTGAGPLQKKKTEMKLIRIKSFSWNLVPDQKLNEVVDHDVREQVTRAAMPGMRRSTDDPWTGVRRLIDIRLTWLLRRSRAAKTK